MSVASEYRRLGFSGKWQLRNGNSFHATLPPPPYPTVVSRRRPVAVLAAEPRELSPDRLAEPRRLPAPGDAQPVRPRRRVRRVLAVLRDRPGRVPDPVLQRRVPCAADDAEPHQRPVDAGDRLGIAV